MHVLFEMLGRGTTIDVSELLIHWLQCYGPGHTDLKPQEQRIYDIIERLGEQRWSCAEELLRLHLFESPDCVYGALAAATLSLVEHRYDEVIDYLQTVFNQQPGNTMALYTLGHCHELLDQEDKAIEYYQDCLKFKNTLELPLIRLAAIYAKNADYQQAAHIYTMLYERMPEDITTQLILGHLYVAAGNAQMAIQTFSKAILTHPDSFGFQDPSVDQLLVDGEYEQALEAIEQMLEEAPRRAELLAKRGDILALVDDPAEAIAAYQDALTECPVFLDAAIKLGTQYLRLESFHLAAEQFNKAHDIIAQIIDAYVGLAVAHLSVKEEADALAATCSAAMIHPNSVLLFTETARTLLRSMCADPMGQLDEDPTQGLDEVIKCYRGRLHHDQPTSQLFYELSLLELYRNGPKQAIQYLQDAAETEPVTMRAISRMALCQYSLGNSQLSLEILSQLITPDAQAMQLHYQTALLYMNPVKFAGSVMNLDRQLELSCAANNPSSRISLVLQNLGILDRAQAVWDDIYLTIAGSISPLEM